MVKHKSFLSELALSGIVLSFFFGMFMGPLHEAGHYLVFKLFGYDVTFHYDSISTPIPITDNNQAIAIMTAGWGITFAAEIVALFFVRRSKLFVFFSPIFVFSSIGIFDTVIDLMGFYHGDKFSIAQQTGLPFLLVCVAILVLDGFFIALASSYLHKSDRSMNEKWWLFWAVLIGFIGMIFWLFGIGPLLLP